MKRTLDRPKVLCTSERVMDEEEPILPGDVWASFANAIKEQMEFEDFYPVSYLLTRLPNSGVAVIHKATQEDRQCVHAEIQLLKQLREDMGLETVADTPYEIHVYYPIYSICADCVQLMSEFIDRMWLAERPVRLCITVMAIIGPRHKYELSQSKDLWLNQKGLQLRSCYSERTYTNVCRAVLSLLFGYVPRLTQPNLEIILDNSSSLLFANMVHANCDIDVEPPRKKQCVHDGKGRDFIFINTSKLMYAAEECVTNHAQIESVLTGKYLFDRKQVLEKYFNSTLHGSSARWDNSTESVYTELAHSVVELPGSKVVKVYNCMLYDGHVEQVVVRDLKEEIDQMRADRIVTVTVYQNFTPCVYCMREVLLPFAQEMQERGYQLHMCIKAVELYQIARMSCCQKHRCIFCPQYVRSRITTRAKTVLAKINKSGSLSVEPFGKGDWENLKALVARADNTYYDPMDYYWQTVDLRHRNDPHMELDFEAINQEWEY